MFNRLFPCSNSDLLNNLNVQTPSSSLPVSSYLQQLKQQVVVRRNSKFFKGYSEIVTLAYVNANNELRMDEQSLVHLSKYTKDNIVFCGIVEEEKYEKETLLYKLQQESQLAKASGGSGSKSEAFDFNLKMVKYPFEKDRVKIFFIELLWSEEDTQSIRERKSKLLNLMLMISNVLVINVTRIKNISQIYAKSKLLLGEKGQKRMQFSVCPQKLFIIENNQKRNFGSFSDIFMGNSIFVLNKNVAQLHGKLLRTVVVESYCLKFNKFSTNGHFIALLLLKYCENCNRLKEKFVLDCQLVYNEAVVELYENYYRELIVLYDSRIKKYFEKEKPYEYDYLLDSFMETRSLVLGKLCMDLPIQLEQNYYQRLEEYIRQKERLIIQVNKKKCHFELKGQLESIKLDKNAIKTEENVDELFSALNGLIAENNHCEVDIISRFLFKISVLVEKKCRRTKREIEMTEAQREDYLKDTIQRKKEEQVNVREYIILMKQKKKKDQQQIVFLKDKKQRLKKSNAETKKLIALQKVIQKQDINPRKVREQKIEALLAIVRDLQQKKRQNQQNLKNLQQIESSVSFDPSFERLERRLSVLQHKIESLLQIRESEHTRLVPISSFGFNENNFTFVQK